MLVMKCPLKRKVQMELKKYDFLYGTDGDTMTADHNVFGLESSIDCIV